MKRSKKSNSLETATKKSPAKSAISESAVRAAFEDEKMDMFRFGWVKDTPDGGIEIISADDFMKSFVRQRMTFGACNPFLTNGLMNQALRVSGAVGSTLTADDCNRTLAAIYEIEPQNALEGMLAVQMVAVHNMGMEFAKRALIPDQHPQSVESNTSRADKCFRTFATQIEALNRLRGKSQQKVIVEHVTVNQGGQAIVGQVNSTPTRNVAGG